MLLRILLLIILLLTLPDAYIYIMYIKRWTSHLWLRLTWFIPSTALATAAAIIISSNDMMPQHQPWVSIFMLIFLTVTVPKTLFATIDSVGHLINWAVTHGAKTHEDNEGLFVRLMRILAMTAAIFAVCLLLFGYFYGRHHYVIHRNTLYYPDLPPHFDGYRIAHFSDLHVGTMKDGNEQDLRTIVDIINSQHCDAIMFTGDIVNHQSAELDGFRRDLCRLSATDGVYAVMGNHDYSMYIHYPDPADRAADVAELQRRIRSYGWHLLLNEHITLRRDSDSIVIAGIENHGLPPFPARGDLPRALAGAHPQSFTILLSHDPTSWRRLILPSSHVQLTLSGHTHAGQFLLFGWSPVSHVYSEWTGLHRQGNQVLNISNGIGAVMFPFRFGAWPEINVITLRRSPRHSPPSRPDSMQRNHTRPGMYSPKTHLSPMYTPIKTKR